MALSLYTKTFLGTMLLALTAAGSAAWGAVVGIDPTPLPDPIPLPDPAPLCARTIKAQVVALDQPYFWNRLGAVQPHGMIYALRRDLVPIVPGSRLGPGNVMLRDDKRPRPLVLRMNVGDCLAVTFINWLNPTPVDDEQVASRNASVKVVGLQAVGSITDTGSDVGQNGSSLVPPGGSATYTFYGEREGTHLLYNGGALVGGEGDNGTISAGLFGAVHVEPAGSVWYRSQVTELDLRWATPTSSTGAPLLTPGGQPRIDYAAVYPTGHPFAGSPILAMLNGANEIVHSDLTAIIAGPGSNGLIPSTYKEVGVLPNRQEPFREFTIIFHDEIAAVQAFPQFNNAVLNHTLHSVRDAFAINYGTGGIGAEILANRLGVGPMYDCTECLYEEFFLTAWAVGDPAMVVDVPANAPCTVSDLKIQGHTVDPCMPTPGPKATKAFYPDDPSNVYHSYQNDHVKFRNLLAGSDDHHIFHLHAHQWLREPDGDNSTYLDSQAIGQGTSFTYEIAHEGSGNRNKTPGDSIFHCHFYPHFAQGMWAMWRVHDVFEEGTLLAEDGRPAAVTTQSGRFTQTRALPDAEIVDGTPIPGLVPLPGQPMPPMPQVQVGLLNGQVWVDPNGQGNPGFPFYIPGVTGHRPPHPPLDFYVDPVTGQKHDGGLPRHVVVGGTFHERHDRLSFEKGLLTADAIELNEGGERWEKEAMLFHADLTDGVRDGYIKSYTPEGLAGLFAVNGADPVAGAPYADPCLAHPTSTGTPPPQRDLIYKAANIEMDVVFNKEGWHFPQQRFLSLWDDVNAFLNQGKPPEPFFFRGNTYDCVTYLHTNLVPKEYELDDFQVRTPTDILGQHIHLVKFDVTSSDGGGNGFNYEDGTFSPEEVVERIHAINQLGGLQKANGTRTLLTPKQHPYFAQYNNPEWLGAQTTVQRWYVDDVLNLGYDDRTLRTVFTHDHFGPSTHQQTGLYAGLVVEPQGTKWYHNETGVQMGTRHDGGPTGWQAVIEGQTEEETYREFLFEFGDFQHAYLQGSPAVPDPEMGWADPANAINPPGRFDFWDQLLTGKPWVYEKPALVGRCPVQTSPSGATVFVPPPCPEAISAQDPGTMVVNYRNEPLALRVQNPTTNTQATGLAGDLSHIYRSNVTRANPNLNTQPAFYQPLTKDLQGGDPYTPLLRAYENDRVQIRILVGSHEEEHNFSVHGVRWLFEPSEADSGFRGSQMMGISEHYEFEVPTLPKNSVSTLGYVDFLYKAGSSVDDLWNGLWGLLRSYQSANATLRPLSTNPPGSSPPFGDPGQFNGVCPKTAPVRSYDIAAIAARQALPGNTLVYNSRTTSLNRCVATSSSTHSCTASGLSGPLHDPTAMLFVRTADVTQVAPKDYRLNPGVVVEPLVLRAAAGECIEVTVRNYLPPDVFDLPGYSLMPNVIDKFNINQVVPSLEVGLHPQMVSYDVTRDDGVNAGFNPVQSIKPGQARTYRWYAGQLVYDRAANAFTPVPTELGAINLISSDPLKHTNKALVGALVIEPEGATWSEAANRTEAKVFKPNATSLDDYFQEMVTVFQNDVNLRYAGGQPVRLLKISEDPAETGQNAVNYRTEPVWFRRGFLPETVPGVTRQFDLSGVFSNAEIGNVDPETPVFTADAYRRLRFRVTHPGGHSQNHVFGIDGHIWEEEPYIAASTVIDRDLNPVSEYKGSQYGHGPSNHFDALPKHGAGGAFGITGDYMWRDMVPWYLSSGIWGILRVVP